MTATDGSPNFGAELKDGFRPACAWLGHGIAWLDEIQQFYRERSVIEKEYSAKLAGLAKRYFEKKSKRSALLSVGDSPSLTPGSLESASLTTWSSQLSTLESRANEHERFANNIVSHVAEPLKQFAARFEELRKRHIDYADKLSVEHDASYTELRKIKARYDGVCQEVEVKRKRTESHADKAKARSAYQQQLFEMNNAKNTYLIAINVTNRQKARYYDEYVPEILDSLQDLSEFRTLKVNQLWTTAGRFEIDMLQHSQGLLEHLAHDISRNEPVLDSTMYLRHNMGSFQEPPDKVFEASPVWHDDSFLVVDETAKVYLRNVLSRSKAQLGDLRREVDKKQREVENLKRLKQRVRDGAEKQEEVEAVRMLFAAQEALHDVERRRLTAEIETSTITSVIGDVTLGAKNHNFKAQTFKIPTNCDLCGERIWGLSAKGFDCRDCGYTCHSKCEMKIPPDCPGEQSKEERKKLKAQRQEAANRLLTPEPGLPAHVAETPDLTRSSTMNSLSSRSAQRTVSAGTASQQAGGGDRQPVSDVVQPADSTAYPAASATPRKRRMAAPPPAAYVSELSGDSVEVRCGKDERRGKLLYTFEASGEGELSVQQGRDISLLEPDDGSGWVKVRAGYKEGLVPAAYVELRPVLSSPPPLMNPAAPVSTSTINRPVSTYSNNSTISTTAPSTAGGKKKGPAVAPRRGARKLRYVVALYPYAAQSEAEHSMAEGERFLLIREDPGDGWIEVEKAGITATVPAAYVEAL